nr:hypothetical protein [Cupriavidus sp. D384]
MDPRDGCGFLDLVLAGIGIKSGDVLAQRSSKQLIVLHDCLED